MPDRKDLVVLTADKDAQLGIDTLLDRLVDIGTGQFRSNACLTPNTTLGCWSTRTISCVRS